MHIQLFAVKCVDMYIDCQCTMLSSMSPFLLHHMYTCTPAYPRLCGVCSDLRDGVQKASAAYGHASCLIVSNDFTLLKVQSYMYMYMYVTLYIIRSRFTSHQTLLHYMYCLIYMYIYKCMYMCLGLNYPCKLSCLCRSVGRAPL